MSYLIDASGERLSRTANLPDDISFCVSGWSQRLGAGASDELLGGITAAAAANYTAVLYSSGSNSVVVVGTGATSGNTGVNPGTSPFFWFIRSSALTTTTAGVRLFSANALTTASLTGTRTAFTPAFLEIGSDATLGVNTNALFWGIKCWDRAPTDKELLVESYYSAVKYPTSLNFHWKLISDTTDYSGNGRNATVTGSPTLSATPRHGLWVPRRGIVVPASFGAQLIDVAQSTETDSAQAMGKSKSKAIGLNTETDSVLALTRLKSLAIGLNAETDTAQALTHTKSKAVGLNEETDSALSIALLGDQNIDVGLVTETDSAFAITALKTRSIGLNTETDSAIGMAHVKSRALGLNTETDSALQLTPTRYISVGLTTETDSAFALAHTKAKAIGLALEFDFAFLMEGGAPPEDPGGGWLLMFSRRRGRR